MLFFFFFFFISSRASGFAPRAGVTPTDFIVHIVDRRFGPSSTVPSVSSPREDDDAVAHVVAPARYDQGRNNVDAIATIGAVSRLSTYPSSASQRRADDAAMSLRAHDFDFARTWRTSRLADWIRSQIEFDTTRRDQGRLTAAATNSMSDRPHSGAAYRTSWITQTRVLTRRFAMVATRDITLYALQFVLNTFYGFMVRRRHDTTNRHNTTNMQHDQHATTQPTHNNKPNGSSKARKRTKCDESMR